MTLSIWHVRIARNSISRRHRWLWWGLSVLCLAAAPASAATLPAGFSESVIASGLLNPTAMTFAPDGRLFVCQQGGKLRVISGGVLLPTPFTTLTVDANGERGLLGVAFDPAFQTNQFVYVYYTATTPTIHNRVSRFTANGNVAVTASEVAILDLESLSSATNHNGGAIHFGPDGKLYVAVGENANGSNAQTLANRLGKILRIDSDGGIPTTNPFYNSSTGLNRAIWALGLRNPYTFGFDPVSGQMLINDVGQNSEEEINQGVAGANYGWPITEGYTTDPRFLSPLFAYDHSIGCAISGSAFYNPLTPRFPSADLGTYFFGDYCGGWIHRRAVDTGAVTNFATGISSLVDLAVSTDGGLYYLARGSSSNTGVVMRIDYTSATVHITANGLHRSLTLGPGNSLTVAISFFAGSVRAVNPAEMYVGVANQAGTYWLDINTQTFVAIATPVYSGPLGSFGPNVAVNLPNVSSMSPGRYWWVVVVDTDSNGVPNGTYTDLTRTIIQ